MQFEVVLSLLLSFNLCQSAPHEGFPILNPGGIGGIFKGPNSETIIKGPDGSEIVSEQEGGAVIREDNTLTSPIIVAEPELSVLQEQHVVEPIIASTVAPILTKDVAIAPIVASTSVPILSSDISLSVAEPIAPIDLKPVEIVQQDPHVIETEIIEAPDVEPLQSSDLEGPSGRIITKGSASIVSGPASTTITEPRKIILAPPKISLKTPLLVNPREESFLASLPAITASTAVSLPAVTASSTVNPLNVGIVSSVSPLNVGISTTNAPLLNANTNLNSNNIDLGGGIVNSASIPIVEYSSSNGVLSGSTLGNGISTTEAPNFVSSTITSAAPTEYVQAPYEVFPTTYQAGTGPAQSLDSQTQFIQERYEAIPSNIQGISLDNSGSSQDLAIPVEYLQAPNEPIPRNVQRISKNDNTVFTDGRIGKTKTFFFFHILYV
ncbi:hypothetical protein ABEB36_004002 [Hypothenemus hampei]|uniref:Uncharacterized protein n=1 Tax=Hypothenemus hampei TaxID=57062 RepID=A0ABD1F1X4_HYPHA